MKADKCSAEEARLRELGSYNILDTEREESFDEITRLISRICDTPIAVINLIDRDRQWFKSEIGLGVRETPLESSLCAHALLQRGLFIVPDTRDDPRFADNPLVTGEPNLRFYAGALLETADGYALGTLCVLDYKPRVLDSIQTDFLQVLARQVMMQLDLHRTVGRVEDTIERQRLAESQLILLHEKQRRIADTLQHTMLLVPAEDKFPGLAVKTMYEPALDEALVGGDFFDVFSINENTVALVVGDVSGKGLQAAARTAEIKYALRAYLDAVMSAEYALEKVNEFMYHMQADRKEDGFVVISLVVLDTISGDCSVITAGAEPCLILRKDNTLLDVHSGCQPIGIGPASYKADHIVLEVGDTLMLVTDGVTEARRKSNFFDIEGVGAAAQASGPLSSLTELSTAILASAKAHAGGKLRDDACIVTARLRPV